VGWGGEGCAQGVGGVVDLAVDDGVCCPTGSVRYVSFLILGAWEPQGATGSRKGGKELRFDLRILLEGEWSAGFLLG
jgi:hypothetical protein